MLLTGRYKISRYARASRTRWTATEGVSLVDAGSHRSLGASACIRVALPAGIDFYCDEVDHIFAYCLDNLLVAHIGLDLSLPIIVTTMFGYIAEGGGGMKQGPFHSAPIRRRRTGDGSDGVIPVYQHSIARAAVQTWRPMALFVDDRLDPSTPRHSGVLKVAPRVWL